MKPIYKVEWTDIQANTNTRINKPFSDYLAPSFTIGEVLKDDDTMLVIYGGSGEEKCFDAIPLKCVIKITKLI